MNYIALTTIDSEPKAAHIAKILVGEKLAACVNILPNLRSIYRWKGKICNEREFLLLIKTSGTKKSKIKKRLIEIHPYECPELIFFKIDDGLPKYLKWIISSVSSRTCVPAHL